MRLNANLEKRLKAIQHISKNGGKVEDLFKLMRTHRDLWWLSYSQIHPNKGAMTKGTDETTVDGFSAERVEKLIKRLEGQDYHFKPARRTYIPKANGKKRGISIPSGDDKLVQGVCKILLEAIYEPIFSDHSHGFRHSRSCHTALEDIKFWNGCKWFAEFDIRKCFDEISHEKLVEIMERRIKDNKFMRIIREMLKAGYYEEWNFHQTYSGAPQGGVISPIMMNIYLHEMDNFVEELINQFSKGKKRRRNSEYNTIATRIQRARKRIDNFIQRGKTDEVEQIKEQIKQESEKMRTLPSVDLYDPNYRRMWYCRYVDDFVIGIIGTREETKETMEKVTGFLRQELRLERAEDKTAIRHAQKEGVRFLGYDIKIHNSNKIQKGHCAGRHYSRRYVRSLIQLSVPSEKVHTFCKNNSYGCMQKMESQHRSYLLRQSDLEILMTYNSELRGFANYYSLAWDVKQKLGLLVYIAKISLVKTFANKHKCRQTHIFRKYGKCISIAYVSKGKTKEQSFYQLKTLNKEKGFHPKVDVKPNLFQFSSGTELIERYNAQQCEYCGKTEGKFEIHHIRKLADIRKAKEKKTWEKMMIARNRKTLVLCIECHDQLHAGKLPDRRFVTN